MDRSFEVGYYLRFSHLLHVYVPMELVFEARLDQDTRVRTRESHPVAPSSLRTDSDVWRTKLLIPLFGESHQDLLSSSV